MVIGNKRIEEIDIIKALGIICMVAGHAGAPFTKFIYLFHMAIFFIASGFFFQDSSTDSWKSVTESIIKKIKQLWIPYFVWNMVFTLLHNIFITINVYTENQDLLKYSSGQYDGTHHVMGIIEMIKNILNGAIFNGDTRMGGALWFLQILFMVSVCYCVGDFLAKRVFKKHILLVQLVASIMLSAFGYWCYLHEIGARGIAQTASFYCLYFIGHLLGSMKDYYCKWDWKKHLPIVAGSFGVLLVLNKMGEIALDQNSYVNPAFFLTASVAGWCFLYSISYFITLFSIKNIFLGIGKRTLTIVILHFLAFKLVAAVVVNVYGLPEFCIAAYPNLYGDKGLWWLAYMVVGVGVPIMLNVIYKIFWKQMFQSKNSKVTL